MTPRSLRGETGREEFILKVAKVCEALHGVLKEAGVRFYYGAAPCGVMQEKGRLVRVVFAGKFSVGAVAGHLKT